MAAVESLVKVEEKPVNREKVINFLVTFNSCIYESIY